MSPILDRNAVYAVLEPVLAPVAHRKRVLSVSLATVGVLYSRRVTVAEVGRSLAAATGRSPKHGIKQVDRLLSNDGVDLGALIPAYIRWVVGPRPAVDVIMDWTDFDADDQTTLVVSMVTEHGRATPLAWRTVRKSTLRGRRNRVEDQVLEQVARALPAGVRVTLLADRGFGDTKLYESLVVEHGWDYVIRFRGLIEVQSAEGESRRAEEWAPEDGSARMLRGVRVTKDRIPVPAVISVRKPRMKDTWCLATSRTDLDGEQGTLLYGRRFTTEESFRDDKDDRFGLGLKETTLGTPERRDRMLFVLALARVLLTALGAAGEELGLDIKLRANTVQTRRTHALLTQGRHYVAGVGVLALAVVPLLHGFHQILSGLAKTTAIWSVI